MNSKDEAFNILKQYKRNLTKQQYLTIKGQMVKGNCDAALQGLFKLLSKA